VLPLRGVLLDDMLCCFTCSTAEAGAKQTLLHGVHRVGTECGGVENEGVQMSTPSRSSIHSGTLQTFVCLF